MIKPNLIAIIVFTLLTPAALHAGEEFDKEPVKPVPEPSFALPDWQLQLNTSYVAPSEVKFKDRKASGDSDAYSFDFSVSRRVTLDDKWAVLLSGGSTNIFLDPETGAPIPSEIHVVRLSAGVEYKWNDKIAVTAFFAPSLYRLEDVRGNDIGYSGGVFVNYRARKSLTLSVGVIGSSDGSYPILPVGGLNLQINEKLALQFIFPKPRLLYNITPKWSVFAGVDGTSATFRTENDFNGKSASRHYNNALASYTNLRVGVGTGFEIIRGVRIEAEGGYSVYRRLEYLDSDAKVKFDPSPYVTISLKSFF